MFKRSHPYCNHNEYCSCEQNENDTVSKAVNKTVVKPGEGVGKSSYGAVCGSQDHQEELNDSNEKFSNIPDGAIKKKNIESNDGENSTAEISMTIETESGASQKDTEHNHE